MYHLIFASKAYIPNFGPAGPPHPFEKFLVVVQNKFYAKKNFQKKFGEGNKKIGRVNIWGGEGTPHPPEISRVLFVHEIFLFHINFVPKMI